MRHFMKCTIILQVCHEFQMKLSSFHKEFQQEYYLIAILWLLNCLIRRVRVFLLPSSLLLVRSVVIYFVFGLRRFSLNSERLYFSTPFVLIRKPLLGLQLFIKSEEKYNTFRQIKVLNQTQSRQVSHVFAKSLNSSENDIHSLSWREWDKSLLRFRLFRCPHKNFNVKHLSANSSNNYRRWNIFLSRLFLHTLFVN